MPRRRKTPAPEAAIDTPVTPALPPQDTPVDAADVAPEKEKPIDPRSLASISLAADANGGPMVRLWRNRRKGVMAVLFDEKPEARFTEVLKEAGFRWQPQDRAWELSMDPDRPWAAAVDAERAFYAVGNAIRQAAGLEPVQGVGV